ncbi:MAG TPA: hypothetical protein V6D20_07485, partial [Candidatus Obscuribacterales bacterium]
MASVTDMNSANEVPMPRMDFLTAFVGLSKELLEGLLEVFPECEKTRTTLGRLNDLLNISSVEDAGKMIIGRWHKCMEPYYGVCEQRNVQALMEAKVKPLEELDMRQKWCDPEVDQETRDHLLDYLIQLNNYARLYHRIPANMMTRVTAISQDLVQKLMRGDFSGINLEEIGSQATAGISEEELAQFTNNSGDIQGVMQSMMATMSPEAAGIAGGMDPSMLAAMMQMGGG